MIHTVREIDFMMQGASSPAHATRDEELSTNRVFRTVPHRSAPEYRDILDTPTQTGGMSLDDPQAWTLIGIFTTMMLGSMTLMTMQFSRVIRAEIGGVRGEIGGLRGELRGDIGGLRGQLESLEGRLTGRIDALEHKVDSLDKEVANLATRFWRSQ